MILFGEVKIVLADFFLFDKQNVQIQKRMLIALFIEPVLAFG